MNRLIAPPISAALMKLNIFAPFWVALVLQGICLMSVCVMKRSEEIISRHPYAAVADEETRTSCSDETDTPPIVISPKSITANRHWSTMYETVSTWTRDVVRKLGQIAALFNSPTSRFCLVTFVVKRIAFASESFMFQYASERFLWPLRQTTWLRVASAVGAVFATLIAWPGITMVFTRKGFAAHNLDLNVVRISLIIVTVSFFWAWRATSGTTLAFGMLPFPFMHVCRPANELSSDGWLWAW